MKKIITLLLIIVCACGAKAQIITTIVGGGTTLGDGGPAVDCELNLPYGIALDNSGNLYIADRGHNIIRKVDAAGIITTIAGTGASGYSGDGGPATAATMQTPNAVATDNAGNVYFSDRFNNCVRKIDAAGIITTIAGDGTQGYFGDGGPATNAKLYGPCFITFDRLGDLYIGDAFNNRIRMVNTIGIITTVAGTGSSIDTGDGGAAIAAGVDNPYAIAVDNIGNIYFTEYGGNRIRKINTSGIITTIAGNDTAGYRGDGDYATTAEFYNPTDIAIDPIGNLDITDGHNGRLRQIRTDGRINTIAGTGTNGFSGDGGEATLAEFNGPVSVAIDPAGSIYISDLGNSRVRYIRNTVDVHITDNVEDKLFVYPNPSDGIFHLLVSSTSTNQLSISIIDHLGRTISQFSAQTNETKMVKENIPSGIYFLSVKDELKGNVMTKLFIR